MRLLDRYLVRQFIPPLLFAFSAMTSIMLLNQVARRFGALVGKGLPWSVIGEVFVLCLPFIVAMTLPMAVLVAMLYTFSHLAADSEITAMRASGISVGQLLRPMVAMGIIITGFNFVFTDQILPKSNARLRNLLINIQRKRPTLELREQVVNEIPPSGLFLRASRIASNGRLRSVTIYDLAGTDSRRIIYADSGEMGFSPQATDLHFRLSHGAIHAFKGTDPGVMQVTAFTTNNILVKDVANRLDLEATDDVRGDREMSTCEMMEVVRSAERDARAAEARRRTTLERDLRALLALPLATPPPPPAAEPLPAYCRWARAVGHWWAGTPEDTAAGEGQMVTFALGGSDARPQTPLPAAARWPPRATTTATDRPIAITSWAEVSAAKEEVKASMMRADQYAVEVHKKWAISVACLVFAIVGIPMALRFPRGGMGLVIGGGLSVFAVYYVGLIAGEGLGDKDIVAPWVAMWGPNMIFAIVGFIGLYRVTRESGSTRGGDLTDLWDTLTGRFRRRGAAG